MSMPPSGLDGQAMDEEASIEAEIQFELDNINLDDDPFEDDGEIGDLDLYIPDHEGGLNGDFDIPNELDNYIKRIQDQTRKFEEELDECDDLLQHSHKPQESVNLALIPYDDQQLLDTLARELGCSVQDYKKKVLEEIEQDDFEIRDELAEFIDNEEVHETKGEVNNGANDDLLAITDGTTVVENAEQDVRLERDIKMAVEEGIDPSEVPVSQDLLPANKQINNTANAHLEIQNMLRAQLEQLETKYEGRLEQLRKDDAFRKNEEEVREKRLEEERLWKKQELEREKQKLKLDKELAERKYEAAKCEVDKEFAEQTQKFEREIAELQAETARQTLELERGREEERQKQSEKQTRAAVKIQSTYRGYCERKSSMPVLKEKKEIRLKEKEEKRIIEVEKEIEARNEEKNRKEEEDRLKKEEEKKNQEEIKRQKELEKQQKEEEKRRKKEEEEQKKQEEKRRKEEEKQRKKEEERRRKEEEKKKKEEDEQRKKEEKRLKEEQERQRKEEEKRRKEEEKRQKEEEKRMKEEEKRKTEEERKQKEEQLRKEKENNDSKVQLNSDAVDDTNNKHEEKNSDLVVENGGKIVTESKIAEDLNSHTEKKEINGNANEQEIAKTISETKSKEPDPVTKSINVEKTVDMEQSLNVKNTAQTNAHIQNMSKEGKNLTESEPERQFKTTTPRSVHVGGTDQLDKLQQGGHIPHPPTPRKKNKSAVQSKPQQEKPVDTSMDKIDCLPEQLESMRLQFMKECQPWSKVSNEPWKLKTGISRKPLRRPSSAKKLPLVPENVILQAAKAASLQQVTTVQLSDLPGNNMSPLGQCWGLKYLTMTNCNLVALDSLGQCKQLQYIDVRNNKLEYLDLKDVGQLQYLNVSHNRLSSIHGIDNCSSLRWLDLSHNNITKLGGLDTLRRLNTLKVSHNQLISANGLGATPTLQMIDMSHNHLQEISDLDKLCLLLSLDLSSNNLLKVPTLQNQVLLQDVNLSDNSISSMDELSTVWLPLLTNLNLSQNSLSMLTSLQNCLTLKKLDLSNNQLIDFETVSKCVEGCLYLESLLLEDNPVSTDLENSSLKCLEKLCPRLQQLNSGTPRKLLPIKPRTSFETMCLTQSQAYRDVWTHFDISLKSTKTEDLAIVCDLHYKYCEKSFNMAVEHRYAHEYGEVAVTMPTAPTTPKSGRPKSARQKETFSSPKDMFENALRASNGPKDMFENALRASNKPSANVGANTPVKTTITTSLDPNPRDLFEQALKSTGSVPIGSNETRNQNVRSNQSVMNGMDHSHQSDEEKRLKATVTIQAYCRGWLVRHEIAEHTKIWLAATTIQAWWRGHWVRKQLSNSSAIDSIYSNLPPDVLNHLNKSAVKIQAMWKGYNLRRKLLAALEYAQCNFDDEEEDEDAMMFGDDFDLDKFVSFDQNLLDDDWKPPATPDIPAHLPVLKKPPSGRAKIPPIPLNDHQPPNKPGRAWRNVESPISDLGKLSRPPSSVASTDLTARTGVSRKEERLTEEWGFKDTNTAHLMMQRAKKMKLNAERRNKINKLDPKQRLALYRKLEEVTHPRTVQAPQRKTLPRKEYFKARQDEIERKEYERVEEYNVKASRTFEWLHSQVGDHTVTDSVINKGYADGPKYVPETNLPGLQGIRRVQLVSPGAMDLQSVESISSAGHSRPRRSSAGTGSSNNDKLPPIHTTSAPTQHAKERMSFRNPRVNQSVGWGGGKKRSSLY